MVSVECTGNKKIKHGQLRYFASNSHQYEHIVYSLQQSLVTV